MKYKIKKITYGYAIGYEEAEIFSETMKIYQLALVEAGTWKKKIYLVREEDLEWLLNESLIDKKEKLQTSMLTCGSLDHIEHWLQDKIANNFRMLISGNLKEDWIPVELALPKPVRFSDHSIKKDPVHVTYLSIFDKKPICDQLALYCEDGSWRWYDQQCYIDDMEIVKVKITAWQPLPKPYPGLGFNKFKGSDEL